jgi:glycosyltransferase involved in cell wall biosynthesis
MKKNIYLVSNSFKSLFLFRKDIIYGLCKKKFNLILIANDDEYANFFLDKEGIHCVRFRNLFNSYNLWKNFLILLFTIQLFFKIKPHLVQTYTLHPNILITPLAKFFSSKTICMVTGMGAISIVKNNFIRKIYNQLHKFSLSFCDRIIFVNNHDKNYFRNILKIKKPYIQIYGAGIGKKINSPKNFFYEKFNLKNYFNIIFVGRLIEEKGFASVIRIFKKLNIKNKKLIIIGNFDSSSFSKSKNNKMLNYPGIIWVKKTNKVENFLKISDVFLFPSLTEGMPTVIMEAIKCDLPIICFKIAGIEDIIKNNINAFVHRIHNLQQLENSIIKIYNNKKKINYSFGANNQSLKIKFQREKIIIKIAKLYDNLLYS